MHVAIDLTPLQLQATGCDTYMLGLVRGLADQDRSTRYTLFMNRGDRGRLGGPLPQNFSCKEFPVRARPLRLGFQQVLLPVLLRRYRVDVLHSLSFLAVWTPIRAAQLLTVHDMTFFTDPHSHNRLRRSLPFRAAVRASIARADLVAVPSRDTAAEVRRQMPWLRSDGIRVIPLGVSGRFAPAERRRIEALGLPRPYILHVGTHEPRKNLTALLDAYTQLAADGKIEEDLVLAGARGWGASDIDVRLRAPVLKNRVHRLGYVSDEDLVALYSGARLFVFPSLDEGFGLPPLEAMACGAPTLAAATGALAENLAGAAALVAPDADALRAEIARLLGSPEELTRLREAGRACAARFTWQNTASATLACYGELAAR